MNQVRKIILPKMLAVTVGLLCTCQLLFAQAEKPVYVNADGVAKSRAYSHAIILEHETKLVKTSGIIGTDDKGVLVTTTPREQIRRTFENIRAIVTTAGAGIDDIIEIQTFLTDTSYLRDYALERRSFFQDRKNPPVVSKTYYAKALINPAAIVEIDVVAVLPDKKSNDEIFVTAVVRAKKGKAQLLKEELQKNIEPTKNEKGCLSYELFQSMEDEHVFTLHEKWTSAEALQLHFSMPYMKNLSALGKELIESTQIIKTKGVK